MIAAMSPTQADPADVVVAGPPESPSRIVGYDLARAGQMAFTWHFAHILLGLGFVIATGWDRAASAPLGLLAGVAYFALAVVTSAVLKSFARHGPLEWLLRKVAG